MIEHIVFDPDRPCLSLLDQRLLPNSCEITDCSNYREAIAAIRQMVVRGAPAIGVTAAFACVLAAKEMENSSAWRENLERALDEIASARPTAVNLAWAVEKMRKILRDQPAISPRELVRLWTSQAFELQRADRVICERIGEIGQELIKNGDCVLTHCNAGALATAGYGTALAPVRSAVARGKKVSVIADETRPLLQGARLTAWELAQDRIPVSVACDNACATLMFRKLVQLVITGADRIAANGDTANKTGTCGVAIMARYYGLPFYIAAPLSTVDLSCENGKDIPIEQRAQEEVSHIGNTVIMPSGVPAWNFAFDVTPAELISGIITEAGILKPPYGQALAKAMKDAGNV